ncbi:hypothetical protein B5E56_00395 [Flavonifractor sp. An112]|uniref:DUF7000 family protein n=1 Tax=Flavonifractor sp. An112 TaxID=1965544 RepID=UPI000B3A6AC7|nr:hypothetical protein [Flavonifractor sp. An112]OUQ61774.1 hypothetical protein B5E56_00395 [Flavonifractor sp. An112]
MNFDPALLETYRALLQTTDLQKAYQEFVRLFRFLRNELERQLPDFRFQRSVTENAMDYTYFSFTNPALKEKDLKLVVAFEHKNFRLEVWLSGANRIAQCRWAEQWRACPPPMELTQQPNHTDFVVRLSVETDLSDGEKTVAAVKEAAVQLLQLLP